MAPVRTCFWTASDLGSLKGPEPVTLPSHFPRYNGGPGASSLFGLLVELGPLLLNMDSLRGGGSVDGAAVPRLIRNPYSWTKVRSVGIQCCAQSDNPHSR